MNFSSCNRVRQGFPTFQTVQARWPTRNPHRLLLPECGRGPLLTILVAKEKGTKMVMATVVPMKGASVELPVRRVLAFIRELGLENSDLVFKSDQEVSVLDLMNNIWVSDPKP